MSSPPRARRVDGAPSRDLRDVERRARRERRGGARRGGELHRALVSAGALTLTRALLLRPRDHAFLVADSGSTLEATDITVRDVQSGPGGTFGRGLIVQAAGNARVTRLRIDRAADLAVAALDRADLTLTDARIVDTLEPGCASTTCGGRPYTAVMSAFGSRVTATELSVERSVLCGLAVFAAEMDVSGGTVSGCDIGACVQADGFDVARIATDVVFRDNGSALSTTMLPVPQLQDVVPDL